MGVVPGEIGEGRILESGVGDAVDNYQSTKIKRDTMARLILSQDFILLSEVVEEAWAPVTAVRLRSEVECLRLDLGVDLREAGIKCLYSAPSVYGRKLCGVSHLLSSGIRKRVWVTH